MRQLVSGVRGYGTGTHAIRKHRESWYSAWCTDEMYMKQTSITCAELKRALGYGSRGQCSQELAALYGYRLFGAQQEQVEVLPMGFGVCFFVSLW